MTGDDCWPKLQEESKGYYSKKALEILREEPFGGQAR